jgi:hypothetical protein
MSVWGRRLLDKAAQCSEEELAAGAVQVDHARVMRCDVIVTGPYLHDHTGPKAHGQATSTRPACMVTSKSAAEN